MDDKRFNNANDDYEELLKSVDSYFDDDYIELSSGAKDEFEDIFSNSQDVYISRPKKAEPEDEGIYISQRRPRDIYKEEYSPAQTKPRSQGEHTRVYSPQTQRTSPAQRTSQTPTRVPPIKADPKSNTQQIRRVVPDEDVSDYEARFGKKGAPSKKSVAPKIFLGFIALVLVVCIAVGGVLFTTANSIVSEFKEAEPIEHIEDLDSLVSESHVRNILLIGADKEKGGASRSDSIMIASVNSKTGKITVVSILRDTHVDVPGNRESKINAAYAWGGANLLIQTVEQNFGIKIDDYATVDFEMFTALIDGLGGIEVDVTENEADYINNRHKYGKEEKPETVPSGENVHLTGYQALWYARIRKLDSDFNRTERQRKVIAAIMNKAKDMGVTGLISTAKDVAPYVETTLSTTDFWSLVFSLVSCVTKNGADMDEMMVSEQLPFEGTWWYSSQWDGSSISLNLDENRQLLYELLYEEGVEKTSEESTEE